MSLLVLSRLFHAITMLEKILIVNYKRLLLRTNDGSKLSSGANFDLIFSKWIAHKQGRRLDCPIRIDPSAAWSPCLESF